MVRPSESTNTARPKASSFGRWLVALALMLFVAAPTLDQFACAGEPEFASVETAAVHQDHAGDEHDDSERPGHVCIHGHCHHGGAMTLAIFGVVMASPDVARAPASFRPAAPPLDFHPSGLERPPRA